MTTTVVHIPIDEKIKLQATEILTSMGISIPDAVRFMLERVAIDKALPFSIYNPNAETKAALEACRRGEVASFASIEALMVDLNADD